MSSAARTMGALPVSATAQRRALILTTLIAVVSDAMLIPFYPKLFREAFAVTDPRHVGSYLAATCLTVILALPLWARLERRVSTLRLLVVAQAFAGLLSLWCSVTQSLWIFWCASLAMIVFKASYLLVYPYILRLEDKGEHGDTVGLLTVVVHLGGISGAAVGGALLEVFPPQIAFVGMAIGDFIQMGACLYLLARGEAAPFAPSECRASAERAEARRWRLAKLGGVMLLFYFSVFVLRPFFVAYWATRSAFDGELVSGLVFAIPAFMSFATLALGRRWRSSGSHPATTTVILRALALGALGVVLQRLNSEAAIISGRAVFGYAVYRAMVHLDLRIFESCPKESYASDFSWMNLCQQLGVLIAFYGAGVAVNTAGLTAPFALALVGLVLTGLAYRLLINARTKGDASEPEGDLVTS